MRRPSRSTARAAAVVATLAGLVLATAAVAAERLLRAPVDDGVITLLLLGADEGPYRGGTPLSARADAFHLLFVSPDRQHATFVDFPRDAYVPLPGQGRTKINACLASGPDNCVRAVEQNFGVDVDHYLLTDFRGLAYGVEGIGGVEIEVERRLVDAQAEANLQPGRQILDGRQALAFSRARKSRPNGDFGRAGAQARLLTAAHRQVVAGGVGVARAAELAGLVAQTTVTDAPTATLLRYGFAAMTLPPDNVAIVTLPGNVGSAGGASVVFLPDRAYALIRDAADDGVVAGR
ncbi:MAG: LCP family protein [Actinobacteria bacterium]|nr:LCP family protein [Actinomycetota bacterium]